MHTLISAVVAHKASDRIVTVDAGATVADAVATMVTEHVGAILVKNEDELIEGIFTERDLLTRVVHAGRDPKSTPISMVMTRDVAG